MLFYSLMNCEKPEVLSQPEVLSKENALKIVHLLYAIMKLILRNIQYITFLLSVDQDISRVSKAND